MKQEKEYSCGAFAVKIAVEKLLNKKLTEKTCRKVCGTTIKGTDEKGIKAGLQHWGLDFTEHNIKNKGTFIEKFKNAFANNHIIIISIHDYYHWVTILEHNNRRFLVIDSDFSRPKQWLTLKQIEIMANSYDKISNTSSYYFFEIGK